MWPVMVIKSVVIFEASRDCSGTWHVWGERAGKGHKLSFLFAAIWALICFHREHQRNLTRNACTGLTLYKRMKVITDSLWQVRRLVVVPLGVYYESLNMFLTYKFYTGTPKVEEIVPKDRSGCLSIFALWRMGRITQILWPVLTE